MGNRSTASAKDADTPPLLEVIRQTEGKVKRQLAFEGQAAQAELDAAERRARELIAEAEAEGQRQGEEQCQAALAAAEAEAQAIVNEACAHAKSLQRVGAQRMVAAVQRVVALVVEVRS